MTLISLLNWVGQRYLKLYGMDGLKQSKFLLNQVVSMSIELIICLDQDYILLVGGLKEED